MHSFKHVIENIRTGTDDLVLKQALWRVLDRVETQLTDAQGLSTKQHRKIVPNDPRIDEQITAKWRMNRFKSPKT